MSLNNVNYSLSLLAGLKPFYAGAAENYNPKSLIPVINEFLRSYNKPYSVNKTPADFYNYLNVNGKISGLKAFFINGAYNNCPFI